jgi:L-asparaginase/Glu-tRNA(Gln) amidotransferase subunit D
MISIVSILIINNCIQKNNYDSIDKKILLINTKKDKIQNNTKNLSVENYHSVNNTSESIVNDWNNIAQIISNNYHLQDAFIILSDSETTTYLASALSFILENISKPIIITTEQINDTIKLSTKINIPEVMIKSNNNLLRGCCTAQINKNKIDSPNYMPLNKHNCLKIPQEQFKTKYFNPDINIILVKFFPGININYILNMISDQKIDGIILELYCDNKINVSQDIINLLGDLINKDVIVIAVSQCNYYDNIDINLLKVGVIPGFDMTSSAAFTKLMLILSYVKDKQIISQLFERSLRGEISQKYSVI